MPPEGLLGQLTTEAQLDLLTSQWPMAGGEMGQRIRSFDWSATPLGPLTSWPPTLRTVVDLMLCSPQPVYIALGGEHISLHSLRNGSPSPQGCLSPKIGI